MRPVSRGEFQPTQNSLPSGVVHDHEVGRVLRVVVPGPALHAGTQSGQFGHLRLDDLDPPLHGQRVIAARGVQVEMEPVLPGLRLRHLLKPDRRAQPGRVEEPVVEGRILP
jgi:hypothetical protein